MKTSSSKFRQPAVILILSLAAGMMVQNIALAQGRKGGGRGGMQRGGKVTQRGGSRAGMQRSRGVTTRPVTRKGSQHSGMKRPANPFPGAGQNRFPNRTPGKTTGNRPGTIKPARPVQSGQKRPGFQPGTQLKFPGKGGKLQRPATRPLPHVVRKPGKPHFSGHLPKRPGGSRPVSGWKGKQRSSYFQGSRHDCLRHCHYVRRHAHLHWNYRDWCGYYPTRCHWWYDWCGSGYYFDPTCCVTYDWYYCPVRTVYRGVVQQYSWHLGLNCVFIPGRGLGIQEVEAGSPADLAGLTAGMVIRQADGVDLADEGAMPAVLQRSGGLLNLAVIADADQELLQVAVQMQRRISRNF